MAAIRQIVLPGGRRSASATSSRHGCAAICTPIGKPAGSLSAANHGGRPAGEIVRHRVAESAKRSFVDRSAVRQRRVSAHRRQNRIVILQKGEHPCAESIQMPPSIGRIQRRRCDKVRACAASRRAADACACCRSLPDTRASHRRHRGRSSSHLVVVTLLDAGGRRSSTRTSSRALQRRAEPRRPFRRAAARFRCR